jgi:cytochrome c-type biogenesis protein CcmH/NrfF
MGYLMRRLLVSAGLLAVLLVGFDVHAENEAPDVDWAYALAHEVMSPFCPGRTLAECPSPNAAELRMWIITQAAAGADRDEVTAMLYERFGEDVLRAAPRAEGWGLSAYAVPIVFFVLGGPVVLLALRRMVARGETAARAIPVPPDIDPSLEAGLREELERVLRGG